MIFVRYLSLTLWYGPGSERRYWVALDGDRDALWWGSAAEVRRLIAVNRPREAVLYFPKSAKSPFG